MKLVSLNLCGYVQWEERETMVVDFLNKANADIVCFQEVKFDITKSADNQVTKLNQMLEEPYRHSASSVTKFYRPSTGEPFREGLASLSRYPIVRSEALVLHKAEDDKHPRIIQNLDLDYLGEELELSNIHFSNNKYSVEHLREALSIFKAREKEPIIVGDFNIFQLSDLVQEYTDYYSSSSDFYEYISYPSESQRLDYVLLPLKYRFTDIRVEEGLSDHNALIVEFS